MQLQDRIDAFIRELKQCSLQGSYQIASQTINILKHVIGESTWTSASELIKIVEDESKRMINAQPSETAVGNMVGRVLKIIREECSRLGKPAEGDHENKRLLLSTEGTTDDFTKEDFPNLKAAVIDCVNELIEEIDACVENIAMQALEHIHANEVILTAGKSKTVEAFLQKAAKKRKFQVIVVEGAPFYEGHELALSLAQGGIETTVITDSAVFAIMSHVNKVFIGTHTVMSNGGLKAVSGSHAIALAAKYHSVPLNVCAPVYKLSPQFLSPETEEGVNHFVSPEAVLPFSEGSIISDVQTVNPRFDYVPPDLVSLFITNIGGNAPSYIYRLVSELY